MSWRGRRGHGAGGLAARATGSSRSRWCCERRARCEPGLGCSGAGGGSAAAPHGAPRRSTHARTGSRTGSRARHRWRISWWASESGAGCRRGGPARGPASWPTPGRVRRPVERTVAHHRTRAHRVRCPRPPPTRHRVSSTPGAGTRRGGTGSGRHAPARAHAHRDPCSAGSSPRCARRRLRHRTGRQHVLPTRRSDDPHGPRAQQLGHGNDEGPDRAVRAFTFCVAGTGFEPATSGL